MIAPGARPAKPPIRPPPACLCSGRRLPMPYHHTRTVGHSPNALDPIDVSWALPAWLATSKARADGRTR